MFTLLANLYKHNFFSKLINFFVEISYRRLNKKPAATLIISKAFFELQEFFFRYL